MIKLVQENTLLTLLSHPFTPKVQKLQCIQMQVSIFLMATDKEKVYFRVLQSDKLSRNSQTF